MKCTKCGTEFNANFCPNCGTPTQQAVYGYGQPIAYQNPATIKRNSPLKIVGIVVASVFAFFIIVAIISSANNPSPAGTDKVANAIVQESSELVAAESVSVDYRKLHKDYMDNAIGADAKYKGKSLILTGKIDSIDREIDQSPYITFSVGDFQDIRIDFNKDEESKIAELKKGQIIKVVGICDGTLLSSTVVLKDSILAK